MRLRYDCLGLAGRRRNVGLILPRELTPLRIPLGTVGPERRLVRLARQVAPCHVALRDQPHQIYSRLWNNDFYGMSESDVVDLRLEHFPEPTVDPSDVL